MDNFAQEMPATRAEIFTETAAQMNVAPIIVEKDFWVCWTLKRVFSLKDVGAGLIFKGGTSLSKAYGIIHRFSEDIDLSLNRHDLGFTDDRDPASLDISNNARKRLLKELTETCTDIVQGSLRDQIITIMQEALPDFKIDVMVSESDPQTLIFNYPESLKPPTSGSYLQDKVKLEFGARSDHLPAESRSLSAYAAQYFPDQFKEADVNVNTLGAERTFWEKATILHMLYYRAESKDLAKHMSRHYYDFAELAQTDVRSVALGNLDLLTQVAQHKNRFFPSAEAQYDQARPPTLKLSPHDVLKQKLRRDYQNMQEMIFHEAPDFDDVLDIIKKIEADINAA